MRRPTSTPPELPGYTYVRLLGSGGFSDVFLYDQHLPKRRVAVKVLLTEELTSANRAAFVAEANLMAQLSAHPYIVSIFHADVASDDRPYFVMEYCSGPSLAERYKREPFSVADVLRTGVRVSGAVATAHAAGILHRDIKPANILTNDYGWPALTDFGISSAVDDDVATHTTTLDAAALTSEGDTGSASVGMSVPWSPPEMFEDDPDPDVRADVFSLAATLYTLLAGHTPFEVRGRSNGVLDLIGRIERGLITPLQRTDVPNSLVAVLRKGMATRREDRFATAVEFARALQRVELELGYVPTTIDVPNLAVEESVRTGSDDDDDATRARTVSTIEAQSSAPSTAFTPPPASDDDATRVRGATTVQAQPTAHQQVPTETVMRPRSTAPAVEEISETPEPAPVETPEPASRVNRVVLWVSGAAVLLVAAVVTVGLLMGGVPTLEGEGDDEPTQSSAPVVVASVPTPELDSAELAADGLHVTVTNPSAEDGDSFIWRRVDRGTTEPMRSAPEGEFVIEGVDGSVCFEVSVVRSGRDSARPLEVCHPE